MLMDYQDRVDVGHEQTAFVPCQHRQMVGCRYTSDIHEFDVGVPPKRVRTSLSYKVGDLVYITQHHRGKFRQV